MKTLNMNFVERQILETVLFSAKDANIDYLRKVNRAVDILEKIKKPEVTQDTKISDLPFVEVSFEDSDFQFIYDKFIEFSQWNPLQFKVVLELDKKLKEVN